MPDTATFAEQLTKPQKKIFEELQQLLTYQERTLDWYHRVGSKLIELQEAAGEHERGWFTALADALGPSTSSLTKIRKFAADFTRAQAQRLDQQGCNWGMVTQVMHVKKKQDRLKLLSEVAGKDSKLAELQAAIRKRHGANHAGGRPLRQPVSCEAALNQLDKLGETWLRHYHEIWAGGEDPMRENLAALTAGDRRAVRQVLPHVRDTIGAMKKALTGLERSLDELDRKQKG